MRIKFFILLDIFCVLNIYAQVIDDEIRILRRTIYCDYTMDMDSISATFVIVNKKDKIVKVLGTDKACTCSYMEVSSNEILPNDSIEVKMNVAIQGNDYIDTYSVVVLSTLQKYYRFRIKGKLKEDIIIE